MFEYWILGVGLIFGFAMLLTILLKGKEEVFLGALGFFSCFMVWGNVLPLWIPILDLIFLIIFLYFKHRKRY